MERAMQNPEGLQGSPTLSSLVPPGTRQRLCPHVARTRYIARWLGSWAFLPAPAKAGLHNSVDERQLGRGQGESLLGKLGSSPSPHGLQVC